MTIVLKLQVEGHEDGEIVINSKKLLEVVKELPDFPVLVSVDDYIVTIKSESGFQCNLTGFDASEYPALPDLGQAKSFSVPLKDLRFLSEKTTFAVSVGLQPHEPHRRLLRVQGRHPADGGHRRPSPGQGLDRRSRPARAARRDPARPRPCGQVLRMSEDPEQTIQVEIGPANARFCTDTIVIFTKLIEGPYPNYENVIPKDFSKKMKANREHLASVIRRVATMANAKTKLVVFGFQERQLALSAKNQDLGGDSEEVPARRIHRRPRGSGHQRQLRAGSVPPDPYRRGAVQVQQSPGRHHRGARDGEAELLLHRHAPAHPERRAIARLAAAVRLAPGPPGGL